MLALKELVEIICSEESSEGPESRGDSLVIQCLGNNNNRISITRENNFSRIEIEMFRKADLGQSMVIRNISLLSVIL